MDLSECHNLNRVLSLYPYEPLPDLLFHAPIFPDYPRNTQVDEDVIMGCHAQAEFTLTNANNMASPRIIEFMQSCGTNFNFKPGIPQTTQTQEYLNLLEDNKSAVVESTRACHSNRSIEIVARKVTNQTGITFLNKHHRRLALAVGNEKIKNNRIEEKNILPSSDNHTLFLELAKAIKNGMSETSQTSPKGKIMDAYIAELNTTKSITSSSALTNALRNVIALILQRDRCSYSLFSTTKSGEHLCRLLSNKKYRVFAGLVLGSSGQTVRYRDLRSFVLSSNDEGYFNAKNNDRIYNLLKDSSITINVSDRPNTPTLIVYFQV
jgi:hypothetical protein